MELALFYWWNLHIITIEVGEVGIGIAWRREFLALKLDGTQWLDRLLVERDASAIQERNIRITGLLSEQAYYLP